MDEDSQPKESSEKKDEVKKTENETQEQANKDPELDITSDCFNPLKALYAPEYRCTEKQPKIIYQNMAAFETALKKVGIWNLNKRPKSSQASGSKDAVVKEDTIHRRFQDHQMTIKTQPKIKSKHQRNIMMQMAQMEGPLKQLRHFLQEGKRIKVLVRRSHGIKGYVEGVLKMFDRHWNLLLTDVEECIVRQKYKYVENKLVTGQKSQDCSKRLQQLGITLPQETVKSLGRKRVEIKRILPQIFLRGEHVVLVSVKEVST